MTQLNDLPHARAREAVDTGAPVFLFVNPVEYHGPHLPLHNDHLVSAGLARELHARLAARDPGLPFLSAGELEIGVAEADHPLPTGNRDLAAIHDRALVEQLARLDKTDIMARFRASLLERMASGDLSEDNLARDLHMSRRSLQRRLAEAEATYQSLVDDTRRDMALRYLEDAGKSATDIAFLLGYSQQSAFTRAFRRWSGKTPSAWRVSCRLAPK